VAKPKCFPKWQEYKILKNIFILLKEIEDISNIIANSTFIDDINEELTEDSSSIIVNSVDPSEEINAEITAIVEIDDDLNPEEQTSQAEELLENLGYSTESSSKINFVFIF
jgi:hypothetical protein